MRRRDLMVSKLHSGHISEVDVKLQESWKTYKDTLPKFASKSLPVDFPEDYVFDEYWNIVECVYLEVTSDRKLPAVSFQNKEVW